MAAGAEPLWGWYPDPSRRAEWRFFDGFAWSEWTRTGSSVWVDRVAGLVDPLDPDGAWSIDSWDARRLVTGRGVRVGDWPANVLWAVSTAGLALLAATADFASYGDGWSVRRVAAGVALAVLLAARGMQRGLYTTSERVVMRGLWTTWVLERASVARSSAAPVRSEGRVRLSASAGSVAGHVTVPVRHRSPNALCRLAGPPAALSMAFAPELQAGRSGRSRTLAYGPFAGAALVALVLWSALDGSVADLRWLIAREARALETTAQVVASKETSSEDEGGKTYTTTVIFSFQTADGSASASVALPGRRAMSGSQRIVYDPLDPDSVDLADRKRWRGEVSSKRLHRSVVSVLLAMASVGAGVGAAAIPVVAWSSGRNRVQRRGPLPTTVSGAGILVPMTRLGPVTELLVRPRPGVRLRLDFHAPGGRLVAAGTDVHPWFWQLGDGVGALVDLRWQPRSREIVGRVERGGDLLAYADTSGEAVTTLDGRVVRVWPPFLPPSRRAGRSCSDLVAGNGTVIGSLTTTGPWPPVDRRRRRLSRSAPLLVRFSDGADPETKALVLVLVSCLAIRSDTRAAFDDWDLL